MFLVKEKNINESGAWREKGKDMLIFFTNIYIYFPWVAESSKNCLFPYINSSSFNRCERGTELVGILKNKPI